MRDNPEGSELDPAVDDRIQALQEEFSFCTNVWTHYCGGPVPTPLPSGGRWAKMAR